MGMQAEGPSFSASVGATVVVAERHGQRLLIVPHPKPGIGDAINDPGSARLIPDVEAEPFVQWPDDRGSFGELFRFGYQGIARDFSPSPTNRIQVSITTSYAGVIKAIHYHFEQTDLWVPVKGMFQVFLCDLRESSPACGRINTLFIGDLRPWKLRIPPGVGHGYKVLGDEPGQLVYAMDRYYNPHDEGRIPFDDPGINYDWTSHPR
jgi:dTDP-4-dehydrorhamnose 3,5-epimerase